MALPHMIGAQLPEMHSPMESHLAYEYAINFRVQQACYQTDEDKNYVEICYQLGLSRLVVECYAEIIIKILNEENPLVFFGTILRILSVNSLMYSQ